MEFKIEVKKKLITDNNKEFSVGQEISFRFEGHDYIGEIIVLDELGIVITRICKDRKNQKGTMFVPFDEIEPDSCGYVYYD